MIAVARRGKLAYFEAVGSRDSDANAPMTKDAVFAIASMTKPMASVAAMILYEEGRIALNDPVGKYLPQLAHLKLGVLKPDVTGASVAHSSRGAPSRLAPRPPPPHHDEWATGALACPEGER